MRTVYIDLYGGPGTGKSTLASEIFSEAKKFLAYSGKTIELVTEYAKDCIYSDHMEMLEKYQFKVITEQIFRLTRLAGKVDYVVTDGPILLNIPYLEKEYYAAPFSEFMWAMQGPDSHWSYFIRKQDFGYADIGRRRDQEWADQKHEQILNVLQENARRIRFEVMSYDSIRQDVLERIKKHSRGYVKE